MIEKIFASFRRILPIIKKEFLQFTRDKRSLAVFLFVPSFMLVLFGYALNLDVKNAKFVVYDQDNSVFSRDLISSLSHYEHFTFSGYVSSYKVIEEKIENDDIKFGIIIPSNFEKNFSLAKETKIQILVDGSQSMIASNIIGYLNAHINNFSIKSNLKNVSVSFPQVVIMPRIWYNPELRTANFFIPGLIGFIMMIMAVVATSLTIVREKERNTIEQIIISPVKVYELIAAKLVAPLSIAFLAAVLILVTGYLLFNVQIKGNLILLFIATIIFLLTSLAFGVFISVLSDSQQVAFLASLLSTIIPTLVFSNFVFPLRSMPEILQYISYIIPAKYYLVILRGIILKGVGFSILWEQFAYLLFFLLMMFLISSVILKIKGLK
ncbi:MAG: ABC transporter permease [Ignavibacteria bacterium]|jgi:ABC-2 type transport system permease protein|nr:ABC transporter permease [Ignavibacteria bacterium]MDH7528883.1 ABC transporter permease [Ignavibacteria bacterium]